MRTIRFTAFGWNNTQKSARSTSALKLSVAHLFTYGWPPHESSKIYADSGESSVNAVELLHQSRESIGNHESMGRKCWTPALGRKETETDLTIQWIFLNNLKSLGVSCSI